MTINIQDMAPVAIDTIYDTSSEVRRVVDGAYEHRQKLMHDLRELSPNLPEIPDQQADDLYARIVENETLVVGGRMVSDYENGTASYDDELLDITGCGALIISADHATEPIRKATGRREDADHGTGGLALTLREDTHASLVLPLGRQTGNINVTPDHRAKRIIERELAIGRRAFLSLHGMTQGRIKHQLDDREVHAMIGLGLTPNEHSIEAAYKLQERVRDYGLRAEVSNWQQFYVNPAESPRLKRRDDGSVFTSTLAAFGEGTTTNFVRSRVYGDTTPGFQIEMSRTLRLTPEDYNDTRDLRATKMGVYLGYILAKQASEILEDSIPGTNMVPIL